MAARQMIVYDSLAQKPERSLRQWVESVTGPISLSPRDSKGRFTKDHVINLAQIFRGNTESGAVGAALGFLDAKYGLDNSIVAIDGVGSFINNLASAFLGKHEVSRDFLNSGMTCTGIFSYRRTRDAVAVMERAQGRTPAFEKKSATNSGGNLEDAAKNL